MKIRKDVVLVVIAACVAGIWNPLSRESDILLGQALPTSTKFQVDPFWPKPLPDDWVTGNVGGTCVDSNDHVFILNRTARAADVANTST